MGGDTLESLIADFTEQRAVDWAVRKFEHFDPSWARELAVGETKNEQAYFRRARIVGCIRKLPESMKSGANRPVLVAVVEMKNPLVERTLRQIQFAFAKKILQNAVREGAMGLDGFPSQGLFFFYDRDRFFRLSLVSGEVENRRFKFNEAKRQSFYVNPSRPNNVLKSRLSASIATFADLKEAFSVETLTREFYGRLFAWYEWAMNVRTGVTFPNDSQDATANRRYNNEAVIRLITRLMFVWFIRQRNLVPGILFAVEGVAKLLKDFQATSMEADNYYQAILQNLFFATLNSPIEKRGFIPAKRYKGANAGYFVKTRYRHAKAFKDPARFKDEVMAAVPFLNCALFDCLDKQDHETGRLMLFDGFSENPKRQAHVPNGLFFHPEKGLIPLFERYEFTIDENNADDADVALDPELLGKVFENLLGAFNPETKETARKATGSFYTPREIVDYMVEEALKNHLKTHLAKKHSNEDIDTWLKDLFSTVRVDEGAELPFGEGVRAEIAEALYSCKILDPACGSGAFPMGVLHAMVRLFQRLDPDNTDLNERLLKRYSDDKKRVLEGYCTPDEREEWLETLKLQLGESQRFPNYARKLYLIENCIHGIDIQPIACQISKLRFFISLLCDQLRSNFNQEAKNHGLLALPNLEAKFVCANTLVSLPKVDDELALGSQEIAALRERLQTNRHHIFRARTYSQKERYRKNDEAIRDQIKAAVKTQLGHPDDELVKLERDVIAKLRKDREAVAEPRLKTVRKPIQGDLFGGSEQEELAFETVDVNQRRRDQIDAQIAAAERAIAKELDKASPRHAQAIDQLAGLVASWDPYDQNKVSPFFDMKWMFNMETGFDIVIGNPPYGAKVSVDEEKYYKEIYPVTRTIPGTQKGSTDTFAVFINRGYDLLSTGAVLVYIVPMSITSSEAMSGVHNLLFSNCREVKISSYSNRPRQIFEAAGLRCSIVQFVRTNSRIEHLWTTKMMRRKFEDDICSIINSLEFVDSLKFLLLGRVPRVGSKTEVSILDKMFSHPNLASLLTQDGDTLYYRSSGGRYWNVVTTISTGSTKEKVVRLRYADLTCACLSSSLFWFYQQVYTNGLDLKTYEIEHFPIPEFDALTSYERNELRMLFNRYLEDIELHANKRTVSTNSSYKVEMFKEYKIGYSKAIIDEIDDFIGPLYGLTKEEIEFIKNYEIEYRMADYMTPEEISGLKNCNRAPKSRRAVKPKVVDVVVDGDEDLE